MKTVVSQTIFADVVTLPRGATTDAITSNAMPGIREPVIQVLRGDEIVYTWRLTTSVYAAPVPGPGRYTVRLFDPDRGVEKLFRDLAAERAR